MGRLLKANFYKLFKSKAFYICSVINTAITCLTILILKLSETVVEQTADESGETVTTVVGLAKYKDGISFGVNIFSEGDVLLFMGILSAIFITSEFTYGTMKNIVSKGFEKYKIYISILITMVAAGFIMDAFNFIVSTGLASALIGSVASYNGPLLIKTLRLVAIEMLLHAAFYSLQVMVALIVRNNGGVIAINIITFMFGNLVYEILELIVRKGFKLNLNFSFSDYGLQNNIIMAVSTLNGEHILRPILVGLIFLVVTMVIGITAYEKADVK